MAARRDVEKAMRWTRAIRGPRLGRASHGKARARPGSRFEVRAGAASRDGRSPLVGRGSTARELVEQKRRAVPGAGRLTGRPLAATWVSHIIRALAAAVV